MEGSNSTTTPENGTAPKPSLEEENLKYKRYILSLKKALEEKKKRSGFIESSIRIKT